MILKEDHYCVSLLNFKFDLYIIIIYNTKMLKAIEHNVILIFLLQLVSIPFSIIEQKYYLLILNLIEVSLIIGIHLIFYVKYI